MFAMSGAQDLLRSFYKGFQFTGDINCLACGTSHVSKMKIGDGSLAALLKWDIESGNLTDPKTGAVVTSENLYKFLSNLANWIEANFGPSSSFSRHAPSNFDPSKPCFSFETPSQVQGLEAACFSWQEGYAALNQYDYLNQVTSLCKIKPINSLFGEKNHTVACIKQLSFKVIEFDSSSVGWIGVPSGSLQTQQPSYTDLRGGKINFCFPGRRAPLNFMASLTGPDPSEFPVPGDWVFPNGKLRDLDSAIGDFAASLVEFRSATIPPDISALSSVC